MVEPLQQCRGQDVERLREVQQVEEAEVPQASLNVADVVPVQARQLRELLLRQAAACSKLADPVAEHAQRVDLRHVGIAHFRWARIYTI